MAAAGAVLAVAALGLALRQFSLFRDFVPAEESGDRPTWVWTIPCDDPLGVSLDRSEASGLDPACYEAGPRRLALPFGLGVLGLAAVAIGLFGHRTAATTGTSDQDDSSTSRLHLTRVGGISGAAIVVAAIGVLLPFAATSSSPIASLNERLSPGAHVVPLANQPSRYYEAHVPASLQEPAPALIVLHGSNSRADSVAASTGLSEFAAARDFVAVYPQATKYQVEGFGTGGYWNVEPCSFGPTNCWNPATIEQPDDVRFLRDVIADVKKRVDVDDERVYVVGHSLGGAMANRVGCEAADLIAGIAVLNSSMETDPCRPAKPVPVQIFHTSDDLTVPPKGSEFYKPLGDSVDAWREAHRCEADEAVQREGDFTRTTYGGCAGGVRVELVLVPTGGHDWIADPSFDWRIVMWNFLSGKS